MERPPTPVSETRRPRKSPMCTLFHIISGVIKMNLNTPIIQDGRNLPMTCGFTKQLEYAGDFVDGLREGRVKGGSGVIKLKLRRNQDARP